MANFRQGAKKIQNHNFAIEKKKICLRIQQKSSLQNKKL